MKIFTKKRLFILISVILLGIVGYFKFFVKEDIEHNYKVIESSNIIEKVSVTGKVKPVDTTHLTFEQSGKIDAVYVKVGDHVKSGDILVKLTSQTILAQKQEALANLKQANARLKELKSGTRTEEVKIQQSRYLTTDTSVKNAENSLGIKIQKAFTGSSFIIKTTVASLADNPSDNRTRILFTTNDFIALNNLNNDKFYLNKMLREWESYLSNTSDVRRSKIVAEKNLNQLNRFVKNLVDLTPSFSSRSVEATARLNAWKANIVTTQQAINTAISEVDQAYNAVLSAEKNRIVSREELNLSHSGVRPEQVEMQEASVWAANARVQQIQAEINKTVLTAPFDGIITKMEAKKGEVISLATSKEILVSMIGEKYEIELNVPEVDVSKIAIGDRVIIEFDAFNNYEFESKVKFIEPAETEVAGVVYYQVKIELDLKEIDLEIRSGMSVDVDIITDEKENVIKIPQRKVIRQDGDKIVRIVEINGEGGQDIVEVKVQTGIRDEEGNIEILKGLKEGDKLLLE